MVQEKKAGEVLHIRGNICHVPSLSPLAPCSGDDLPTSRSAYCWSSFHTSTTTQYLKLSKGFKVSVILLGVHM